MRRFDSQGRCVEDRAITDQLRQREAALAARDSPWLRLRSEESLGRTGRRRPATWAPVLRAPAPLFQTHAPADKTSSYVCGIMIGAATPMDKLV